MGLGNRNARRHATTRSTAVHAEDYWDFKPGQPVMTNDGFPGKVTAVYDGPVSGAETYEVALDGGLGGGEYMASHLSSLSPQATASAQASVSENTAARDYPELSEILDTRLDPGKYPASKYASLEKEAGFPLCAAGCNHTLGADDDLVNTDRGMAHRRCASMGDLYHSFTPLQADGSNTSRVAGEIKSWLDGLPKEAGSTVCENGHLQWDGKCPSCRNSESSGGPMVVNPGDHKQNPQVHAARDGQDLGFPPVFYGKTPEEMAADHIRRVVNPEYSEETKALGWSDSPYNHDNAEWAHGPAHPDDPISREGSQHVAYDPSLHGPDGLGPVRGDGCTVCGDSDHETHQHIDDNVRAEMDKNFTHASLFSLSEVPFHVVAARGAQHAYDLVRRAVANPDFAFHVTAAWRDVRAKAKRIRTSGGVHITTAQNGYFIAKVQGDHGTYESVIMRAPGTQKVAQWDCGCEWSKYHWGAPDDFSRFAGRMCSHVLALNLEAQSRGMFGREIMEDSGIPKWVGKHDLAIVSALNAAGHTEEDVAPIHFAVASLLASGEAWNDVALLISPIASVNSPWGEPGPNPVPGIAGGATSPRAPENPASAGFLTAADPDNWSGQSALPSGMEGKFSHLDQATIWEADEPIQATASTQHVAGPALLIPIVEGIGGAGAAAGAAEGGAAAAGAAEGGAAAEGAGAGGRGLMGRVPGMPGGGGGGGGGEGGGKGPMGKVNEFANHVKNWTDRDKAEGDAAKRWAMRLIAGESTLHDEPEPALPTTDGGVDDYPPNQTWSGYAGDPDPDPMPRTSAALRDQSTCPHDGAWNGHGQCMQCGWSAATEDEEQCDHPYCTENNFPEGWHTKGEHIDPSHLDPGHPDYQSAEHGVNDAIGNHPDAWMLDHQPQGPTKYSAIDTGTDYLMPGEPQAGGGGTMPGSNFATDPTSLEPEDQSFVSTGSQHTAAIPEGASVADIVAQFQASGAGGLGGLARGSGSEMVTKSRQDSSDIAKAAAAFLQGGEQGLVAVAMTVFTPQEQQALINEGDGGERNRNADRLQIEGTHYEALEHGLAKIEDDEDWMA